MICILKNTQSTTFWKGILLFHLYKTTFMQEILKQLSLHLRKLYLVIRLVIM